MIVCLIFGVRSFESAGHVPMLFSTVLLTKTPKFENLSNVFNSRFQLRKARVLRISLLRFVMTPTENRSSLFLARRRVSLGYLKGYFCICQGV